MEFCTKKRPNLKLSLKENWLVGRQTVDYILLYFLLFVHIFSVVVQYLLLFLYGFHVKKLCNL